MPKKPVKKPARKPRTRRTVKANSPALPVWSGPCDPGPQGGITFSLLSRYLVCKERFRLLVVDGLRPAEQFNHRIEYGSMWHRCEEYFAGSDGTLHKRKEFAPWEHGLRNYCQYLGSVYPNDREQIEHWYNVCRVQFPHYIEHWSKHPDVTARKPLLQEQVFHVPYKLPSGRTVYLRGKWDSVDLIGKGKSAAVYLQENKSKGEVVDEQIRSQLAFDVQTMMYLITLNYHLSDTSSSLDKLARGKPLGGVRYNVIRRPLSGGKGSIKRLKPTKSNPQGETKEDYYKRLSGIIGEDPDYYFKRWKVEVTPGDLQRFEREFLQPVLENLCDWWLWVTSGDPFRSDDKEYGFNTYHWRSPFGIYNPLEKGGGTELDEYLDTGSTLGLEKADKLFRELD